MRPLCFVLMPFGRKKDSAGNPCDFDAAYEQIIKPAIDAADLTAVRADEEAVGGWIHKPMFERLLLCDYAVADLTGENPNVFYELGIRHALRPHSTVVIFQEGSILPFDVAPLRGLPYNVQSPGVAIERLADRLKEARQHADDSPVYQTLVDLPRHEVDHLRTDVFREKVEYSRNVAQRLAQARAQGKNGGGREAILAEMRRIGDLADADFGTIVDLLLSLRAVEAFEDIPALYDAMPLPVQRNRMVKEQLGFALNRLGRYREAENVLKEVIQQWGANPETNGILGRVYKDQYRKALAGNETASARGFLNRAVDTYAAGFEADWRDAYPGVNAVSLMEMKSPVDPRQSALLPLVRYAAARQIGAGGGDYWDHATLLELAVLANDRDAAQQHLDDALAFVSDGNESFRPDTTADNLRMIRTKRTAAGQDCQWVEAIEAELRRTAEKMRAGSSRP